jgi:hypothetical protein
MQANKPFNMSKLSNARAGKRKSRKRKRFSAKSKAPKMPGDQNSKKIHRVSADDSLQTKFNNDTMCLT